MENYIQVEDYELWMLIKNGPLIPTKRIEDGTEVYKQPDEFDPEDFKKMEKNAKAKKLLYFGLGPDQLLAFLSANQPKTYGMPFK